MGTGLIIIPTVFFQDSVQVSLTDNEQVVQPLLPHAAHPPLRRGSGIRRTIGRVSMMVMRSHELRWLRLSSSWVRLLPLPQVTASGATSVSTQPLPGRKALLVFRVGASSIRDQ
jgi:hypothetical protein